MTKIYVQFGSSAMYWHYYADERRSVGTIRYLVIR